MINVSLYQMGLEILAEKEKMARSVKLTPSDMWYSDFVKYRKAWINEVKAMEDEYARLCYLYEKAPLEEVMAWGDTGL